MQRQQKFEETWGFPSEVMQTIRAASSYEVETRADCFRSGRKKIDVVFYDTNRTEVARRVGMQLLSKKTGRNYEVCERCVSRLTK